MDREEDKSTLLQLTHGKECKVAYSDDGGGSVYKIWDVYILFEIPQYGGQGRYVGRFYGNQIDDLLDMAYSWT